MMLYPWLPNWDSGKYAQQTLSCFYEIEFQVNINYAPEGMDLMLVKWRLILPMYMIKTLDNYCCNSLTFIISSSNNAWFSLNKLKVKSLLCLPFLLYRGSFFCAWKCINKGWLHRCKIWDTEQIGQKAISNHEIFFLLLWIMKYFLQ